MGMTFEKWMEEMKKQMAMEMLFPSTGGPAAISVADEMNDYVEEDDAEE